MTSSRQKVICNVTTQSHLGQFLVFVDSILEHEPALSVYLIVIDIAPDEVDALQTRAQKYLDRMGTLQLTILTLDQIYGDSSEMLRFCYNAFELCMIARGGLHKWLMEHTSHDGWLSLDGDMYCFGPLDPIFARLQDNDLILSAHRNSPCDTSDEDILVLLFGAYNGGLLGVRRSETGRKFVAWFFDRMLRYGRVDNHLPLSLQPHQRLFFFGDQTWLGLVPMYFDNVYILKDRGSNFGPWSLRPDESFSATDDGQVQVGSDRINILHLSGWNPENPYLLADYSPRNLSDNAFWREFTARYLPMREKAQKEFHRPYPYLNYRDGTPISAYQRRAYLKLTASGKDLAGSPFALPTLIGALAADFNTYDYFPPNLAVVVPDAAFPNMVEGNRHRSISPFHRREVPHKWYVDIRSPTIGFVSRDEALILYNSARLFAGKPALEIGCWMGWSACHLALGGVTLDIVDPSLAQQAIHDSVAASLGAAGVADRCNLHAGSSPDQVHGIAAKEGRRWSLIFIDGDHQAPHPWQDVEAVERYADETALILFHDLAFPDVAPALDYLRQKGWQTMIYATMQIMAVAWRGAVTPVRHAPDPNVTWQLPPWLDGYTVSL